MNFDVIEQKVHFTYDLVKNDFNQYYKTAIKIQLDGVKVNPKNISGDFGDEVLGGKNKLIIWDAISDGYSLEGQLAFSIKAELFEKKTTERIIIEDPDDTLKKKNNVLISLLSIGAISASGIGIFNKFQSNALYEDYELEIMNAKMDYESGLINYNQYEQLLDSSETYNKANKQHIQFQQFMGLGTAFLVADLAYLFSKRKR